MGETLIRAGWDGVGYIEPGTCLFVVNGVGATQFYKATWGNLELGYHLEMVMPGRNLRAPPWPIQDRLLATPNMPRKAASTNLFINSLVTGPAWPSYLVPPIIYPPRQQK